MGTSLRQRVSLGQGRHVWPPAVHSAKDKRPLLQALGTGAVDTLSSVWSCAHALQALELGFFRR